MRSEEAKASIVHSFGVAPHCPVQLVFGPFGEGHQGCADWKRAQREEKTYIVSLPAIVVTIALPKV